MFKLNKPKKNRFLLRNKEELKLNQYWYSENTIKAFVDEIEEFGKKVAFLSTPSLYFSLNNIEIKKNSMLFDLDEKFNNKNSETSNFVKFDFKKWDHIPKELHHKFDYVVVDPPFIVPEVWELYINAIKILLFEDFTELDSGGLPKGKVLLTTIDENEDFLKEKLDTHICKFKPSIPNLIYQYSVYTNYISERFSNENPEIKEAGKFKGGFVSSSEKDEHGLPKKD